MRRRAGRHRRRDAGTPGRWAAIATVVTALATMAGVVIMRYGSEAEKRAAQEESRSNDIAERLAEEDERTDRAILDRDRKRYASKVTIDVIGTSPQGPDVIDTSVEFRIGNRAPKTILSAELLIAHDTEVGGDGMSDGMVSVSTSQRIPPCTAVTFALPAGFDLADIEGGVLRGQRLYADELTLLFYQDSVHWQLDHAKDALAGEGDTGYSVRRNTMKTDAGQLVRMREEGLGDCVADD